MGDSEAFRRTEPFGRATASGVLAKPRFELRIGSNIFRNTNGVVTIHGKEQLVIEPRPDLGLFLATLDLYNERGSRIAHLRRNVFTVNESGRFAIDVSRGQDFPAVQLTDLHLRQVALEIRLASDGRVDLASGTLYSHKGILVEITPHYCRIGSHTTLFGEILDMRGGPAILG
jgi:hypothetical protein